MERSQHQRKQAKSVMKLAKMMEIKKEYSHAMNVEKLSEGNELNYSLFDFIWRIFLLIYDLVTGMLI